MGNKYYQLPENCSVAVSTDEMLSWFNLPSANFPWKSEGFPPLYRPNIIMIDKSAEEYKKRVDNAEKLCLYGK